MPAPGRITVAVADAGIDGRAHCLSILLTDPGSSLPLAIDYSYGTAYALDPDGRYKEVSLVVGPEHRGKQALAYLILDTFPVASASVTLR